MQQIRAGVRDRLGDSFHSFIVGGAAVDPDLIDLLDLIGIRTEIGYGLTEGIFGFECIRKLELAREALCSRVPIAG